MAGSKRRRTLSSLAANPASAVSSFSCGAREPASDSILFITNLTGRREFQQNFPLRPAGLYPICDRNVKNEYRILCD